jgi:uncharacterized protein (DUF1015 family)
VPELAPFRAMRYTAAAGDPAGLIAPPYDVIDESEAEELRQRSPYNCVRLVLPQGEAPERYGQAAELLESWLAEGILAEDDEPGVYVYRQRFELGGRLLARRALFTALRLTPFDAGEVLPHERTHSGPKVDRLALMRAAMAQLSPIFLVARDSEKQAGSLFDQVETRAPVLEAKTPDGISHALWRVRGEEATALCRSLGREPLLIADGHHRYETALAYLADSVGGGRAEYVLACVVPATDPGLVVLPTHRALAMAAPDGGWRKALSGRFDAVAANGDGDASPSAVADRLSSGSDLRIGLVDAAESEALLLAPRTEALEDSGLSVPERAISTVVLDRLIFGATLGSSPEELAGLGTLSYHQDADGAASASGAQGAAFLLPAVSVDDIWAAVQAGVRLPPKSTYFAPKMPTGLVFRSLVRAEERP